MEIGITLGKDVIGKAIERVEIGDEDLKKFVINRERLFEISFNRMNHNDQCLIMAVKPKLNYHLQEIEDFLKQPNLFTDKEDGSLFSFLAKALSWITMNKGNGYIAIYIWKLQELRIDINKHSGMSRSTREFLNHVKDELQSYQKDIDMMER